MGVDIVIKGRTAEPLTTAEYERLRDRFREQFPDESHRPGDYRFPDLVWDETEPVPTLSIQALDRYYGPGYERGHWPTIRDMGDWLTVQLGESGEVRYGADTNDEWECLWRWVDCRTEISDHWTMYGNEPYMRARGVVR